MTAIGKLLAIMNLVIGLGVLTWSVNIYVQRPGWFDPVSDAVDKNNKPLTFAQMKTDIETNTRAAAVANNQWGVHLKTLEDREKFRADRRKAFADRTRWAHVGNPKDLIDPVNPKSGKGYYMPVIDSATKLYDLSVDATGKPKGEAILGSDGTPLPGLDNLLNSVTNDVKEINELNKQIVEQRLLFNKLSAEVIATEVRMIKMAEIRDSVQSELFFLRSFEVNATEAEGTVYRREKQLRNRLKILGVYDP